MLRQIYGGTCGKLCAVLIPGKGGRDTFVDVRCGRTTGQRTVVHHQTRWTDRNITDRRIAVVDHYGCTVGDGIAIRIGHTGGTHDTITNVRVIGIHGIRCGVRYVGAVHSPRVGWCE